MTEYASEERPILNDPDFTDPKFKKLFWEWFDSIPRTERKRFQEHPADMAMIYFYNKFYRWIDLSEMQQELRT